MIRTLPTLPPDIPPPPVGMVYIGMGRTFRTGGNSIAWRLGPRNGNQWTGGGYAGNEVDHHYAVPAGDRILAINDFNEEPTPVALPAGVPPVPEGYVYLGIGGTFQTGGTRFVGRSASVVNYDKSWDERDGTLAGSSRRACYAAPIGSPVATLNASTIQPQAIQLPRLEDWMPEPPDEAVFLGSDQRAWRQCDSEFYMLEAFGVDWQWTRFDNRPDFALGFNIAARMSSSIWRNNNFVKPSETIQWERTKPLPEGVPPLPEGFVYLGLGNQFQKLPNVPSFAGMWFPPLDNEWSEGASLSGEYDNYHYAAPVESAIATLNNMNTSVPSKPLPDPPSFLPAVPEGFVYIGVGLSFERPANAKFPGAVWEHNGRWTTWNHKESLFGATDYFHYIVPKDSPIITYNNFQIGPEPIALSTAPKQWILTVGSKAVQNHEEATSLIEPLLTNPENKAKICTDIWNALQYDDPESRILTWIDLEPVVMASIDFNAMSQAEGVSIHEISESNRSVAEIITKAAAGVLLRGGLSNHFRYLETGELIIDPSNPPSLEQGCDIIRRTLEIKETGQRLDNYSAWTLGMLADQMENFFGQDFDPSMVMEQTSRAYGTYITSLGVFRGCWANRRKLSFTHHKEVYYAKITDQQKDWVLDKAEELQLPVLITRKLCTFVRLYGTEGLEENPPTSEEELKERLETRAVNKNFLFFLPAQNKWFEYRGPFEYIPNGASPIFNADTRAIIAQTGTATKLEAWTPVGIEMPPIRGRAARVRPVEDETPTEASEDVVNQTV